MGFLARFLPPYYKYPVFAFCGFELLLTACVLAIAEAYYKRGSLILPISYDMFDDTVKKNVENFEWNETMREQLETYRMKLGCLWALSAVGVTLSMLCIIPQFFDYNDKRGNPSQLCLVRHRLGWILFSMVAIYVVILGAAILWAWNDCRQSAVLFREKFDACEKEEIFLTRMENVFGCQNDDDKEVEPEERCYFQATHAFLNPIWMDAIVWTYFLGHAIVIALIPCLNRRLIKDDDEDDLYKTEENESLKA